ncbi:distal tail protein Dit [Bacillus sp. FSL K6-3431]|uniref:distal tail protein Dit n=1 Tax=Bacillus sp. FSL K6-3431 TaxID=2921500 RepID=UPI0030FC3176
MTIFTEGAVESRVWIDDTLLQKDFNVAVLLNSEEPALPSMRNMGVTVPGRHGAYDFGAYFEPREFALNCVFKRQPYDDLKRQIRALNRLFVDQYGRPKTVQLRFGDEVDKYYNARITEGISIDRVAERGFFTLGLTAFDPYAYSTVTADEILWGSEVITFEFNYLLGTEAFGGIKVTAPRALNVNLHGDALRPIFVIDGSAKALTISANGKSFSLPAFTNTRWEIDGADFTVKRNGTLDLAAMTGDFIELINGDNNVVVGGGGLNFDLTVKYRDKYI